MDNKNETKNSDVFWKLNARLKKDFTLFSIDIKN